MAQNILQIPLQVCVDGKRDITDFIQGTNNVELFGSAAILGLAVLCAPHVLALNGAISLMGSAGRAGKVRWVNGRCFCRMDNGQEVELEEPVTNFADCWKD